MITFQYLNYASLTQLTSLTSWIALTGLADLLGSLILLGWLGSNIQKKTGFFPKLFYIYCFIFGMPKYGSFGGVPYPQK